MDGTDAGGRSSGSNDAAAEEVHVTDTRLHEEIKVLRAALNDLNREFDRWKENAGQTTPSKGLNEMKLRLALLEDDHRRRQGLAEDLHALQIAHGRQAEEIRRVLFF